MSENSRFQKNFKIQELTMHCNEVHGFEICSVNEEKLVALLLICICIAVEDHFAKALGATWTKIQQEQQEQATNTQKNIAKQEVVAS